MNHLFVSYSRKDEALVSAVVQKLRDEGFEVWQDISGKTSGIPYSTKWFAAIEEALYTSAGAVTFESSDWKKSKPCEKENALIEELALPSFHVALDGEDANASVDELVERLAAWAREEVYAPEWNSLRTWLISSVHACRRQKGRFTGIPRYKKRKEGKAFLQLLETCRTALDDAGFSQKNPTLYKDMQDFLRKARKVTVRNLLKKPLALAAVACILIVAVIVVESYGQQQQRSEANIEALEVMEVIHDRVADDEVEALILMARDSYDFADYTPLLYESYADVLSREYPADFYQAGSEQATAIAALPAQDARDGYTVELSDSLGNVTVTSNPDDENLLRTRTFHTSSAPGAYALADGYLAVASAQQCYVIDLARGFRTVELRYCYRDIEAVRFDDLGRICAITTAGDVYVWENPVARAVCTDGAVPSDMLASPESLTFDGSFEARGQADGDVEIRDAMNDCTIWKCTAITEPIEAVYLDETTWTVYARGISGTCYSADASNVLADYSAFDVELQRDNYRNLGWTIIDRLSNDLHLTWEVKEYGGTADPS